MNKAMCRVLSFSAFLAFMACVPSRDAQLVNLATHASSSVTELVLTTSRPLQYKETKLQDVPGFIISFPADKIFSSEKDELVINDGAIKTIRNEYGQKDGQGRRELNSIVVELTRDLPYKISNNENSIVVRIEHPEPFSAAAPPVKMDLEVQPQGKQAPLQEELGYLIGPGDVLIIEVWKYPDVSRDVVVNEEGDIRLPMIKSIRAMGMTVPQLEKKLTQALSQYLVDPSVFVTIKDYNSQRVIAMGEVKAGMYTLKRKTTLTEFLSQIGGPTDKADITRLKLIKKDGKTISYDLNELLKDPQKAEAVLVSGGDTFYVPPLETKKVYVFGQVATQKAIDIKGKYKLVDAIADAGGPTARAITKSIVVVRNAIGSPKAILIDLDKILKKADLFQNIELMPGDIIYVPRSFIADIETFWALITPPMWLLAIFGPIMGIFK